MKKVLTLEVYMDEKISDGKECVETVISEAMGHYYCCDGTVDIKIVENVFEQEEIAKMVKDREKNDNGERYTLDEVRRKLGK